MAKGNRIFRSFKIMVIGICLFMPIIYSLHFYLNRMLHRMEMWEKAESNLLQTIELDSATIHWTKKNRELIVNKEYFDVVSITYSNGKARLKGIFDHEETKMHKAFAKNQNRDTEPGTTTQKIADWLQLQWTFEDFCLAGSPKSFLIKKYAITLSTFLPDCSKQPPVPPPWLC